MIKRLLIANRGEIAVRIIRTCREMGIETVAVYSTADREALHVRLADKAVCIGPPPSAQSYLLGNNLIMAAIHTQCDAIHPGVGFLSENPGFARSVLDTGLGFIGPDPKLIELLGDKVKARATAQQAGLPVTPGTQRTVEAYTQALEAVGALGFPVIIKAAAGGGGKGMRVVRTEQELPELMAIAQAEAASNFGDSRVFIERYLKNPRHVELQILAAGNVAVLGERDCSVQKNHQKLIEESPSPGVSEGMREQMARGAVKLFQELGYRGAGTIEFLVHEEEFYFMEVNARLQVEHPVSECITGTDIVREQILACTEGRMEIDPKAVQIRGWAMECRINALSPGRVTDLHVPGGPGVRFDTCLYTGCMVPPHYDGMVGKLIVHGPNRERVLARMDRALAELRIEGIQTNRAEQGRILQERRFRSGCFGTAYYEELEKRLPKEAPHAR
ncbi:MAG: ATP-grasp domain-containing protein [Treponema sp.]|jgi:acetyl-CoA carboxylase biotin carboxylase subunit|nr:ATP-grasp domain-containing protein [Treponema sp.]